MSSSTTIVIPHSTPRAEALAENIAKLQEAAATLAEKSKRVREAIATETKELQAWLVSVNAPIDIPVNLGPGRSATLTEKVKTGSINEQLLTTVLGRSLGETRGAEMVSLIYDSRSSETEYQVKFIDVVKQAEAKKRRAEAKAKAPSKRSKASTMSADDNDYDDGEE